MSSHVFGSSLRKIGLKGDTSMYELSSSQFRNKFFILSASGSRKLLTSPEVVGYDCYTALLDSTSAAFRYLADMGKTDCLDIFTILRGGLNYPLEEACSREGIMVRDMHFVSCERVIRNQVIEGLDIKYEKIRPTEGRTIAIGDIIASGATMKLCLKYLVEAFKKQGGNIKRIIFFTIGGTRAIDLMEELTPQIQEIFPQFEGFFCFFYEGVFTVYEGPGVSGINVRDIDFGWNGGVISPEFRRFIVLGHPDALLEKCIIYDGGARRYDIPVHLEEVAEYWEGILERASIIDPVALVGEKLGYSQPLDYETWKKVTFAPEENEALWKKEQALLESAKDLDLAALAKRRLASIETLSKQYS